MSNILCLPGLRWGPKGQREQDSERDKHAPSWDQPPQVSCCPESDSVENQQSKMNQTADVNQSSSY